MKKYYLVSAIILSCTGTAQKNECEALKGELTNVKAENAELTKQNLYYKETLRLLTPVKSVSADGLKIDILSAVASKKDKSMTLTAVYINTSSEVRKYAATDRINIVDPRGNQYTSSYLAMGPNNDHWGRDVPPNIPMKVTAQFAISGDDFPILRLITWYLKSNESLTNIPVILENIPVTWND